MYVYIDIDINIDIHLQSMPNLVDWGEADDTEGGPDAMYVIYRTPRTNYILSWVP